jgi:hypothetical protein
MESVVQLELTVNELNLILAALGKQPWESVNGIVNKIISEAQSQLPAAPEAEGNEQT